jgi:hypothetical protein
MRTLRRFLILLAILLLPVYAISLTEDLEVPAQWRDIAIADTHQQVRTKLRDSGLADNACELRGAGDRVRCTRVGRHHACGIEVRFDGVGETARVTEVRVHEPVYLGPFLWHMRLRRVLQ